MFRSLTQYAENRFRAWVRKRQGDDGARVTLNRKRIYILPSKAGLVFAGMVFIMLLAAMNYSNSLGFALTFLLASLGFLAMHQCHATLDALHVEAAHAPPVFAGQQAVFNLLIKNQRSTPRFALLLQTGTPPATTSDFVDLPGADGHNSAEGQLRFAIPAQRRGYLEPGRLQLNSRHPFGLFRAWTWLHMPLTCLVYPAPAAESATPPPQGGTSGHQLAEATGQDDFSGLRSYQKGDSPRHIAWQAYARERGLQVKQFSGQRGNLHWLDWDSLPRSMPMEMRLSVLCRQVLDAHGQSDTYGLRLPGTQLQPAQGNAHKHRCLKALALFEGHHG